MSKAANRLMRKTPVPPPLIRTPDTKDSLVERPGALKPPSPAKEGHVEAQREADRLNALQDLNILDTPNEPFFDNIVELMRRMFSVDMAIIALVDGHRSWPKASAGLGGIEVARKDAFSHKVVETGKMLHVPDALTDRHFSTHPMVRGEDGVRFYFGLPVRSADGQIVGTLAVLDRTPRHVQPHQIDALKNMARVLTDHLALRKLAVSDGLTGVLTRRAFETEGQRLAALCSRHRHALSLICFDLDHFKAINDTYGHQAGDKVLTEVAAACQSLLRESDLFGRVGGEEFGVLLPETSRRGALLVAEKIRRAVSELRFTFEGKVVGVTASFGVARDRNRRHDLSKLMGWADAAMYRAKKRGRNCCVALGVSSDPDAGRRRRVLKAGQVVFAHNSAAIDCTVRSLGADGAGVDMTSTTDVPDRFQLVIRSDGLDARCRVTSRTPTHLEVDFK